ncbi:hypothetical protein Tco_0190623 [Tanacetum coccineum]
MGTVRFRNDHFAAIIGYGDYVQGNITVCHVYFVEGHGHNLFSVGQFYDGDLEVAFRFKTCYVRNLKGDDLLTGARESNLYTISIFDMASFSLGQDPRIKEKSQRRVAKVNSELLNSELLNSELLNSELLNSELLNGELLNSELLNGELLNSELLNGELLNSELLNSELLNSELLTASC